MIRGPKLKRSFLAPGAHLIVWRVGNLFLIELDGGSLMWSSPVPTFCPLDKPMPHQSFNFTVDIDIFVDSIQVVIFFNYLLRLHQVRTTEPFSDCRFSWSLNQVWPKVFKSWFNVCVITTLLWYILQLTWSLLTAILITLKSKLTLWNYGQITCQIPFYNFYQW